MNRREVKFVQQHRELLVSVNTNGNGIVATDEPYTQSIAANPGAVGRWVALGFDSTDPTSTSMLYGASTDASAVDDANVRATTRGFNQSPFALMVPQGVGAQERIGRDISVLKDDWFIRISIPNSVDSWVTQRTKAGNNGETGDTYVNRLVQRVQPAWTNDSSTAGSYSKLFKDGYALIQSGLSQRPIRIRLVCIMQPTCDKPGLFGFRPTELFESQYDIHSRFSKDDACGYKILYDKTKLLVPQNANVSLGSTAVTTIHNRQGRYKSEATFRMKASYLRRYEGRTTPDNTTGAEISVDGSGLVDGGVSRGALTWYMFIEDAYCNTHLGGANSISIGTHAQTPAFISMEVNRKTLWTDP